MTPTQQEELAKTIRERRQELGLSASEVARQAGIQKTTVTRLELAQIQQPQANSLIAIADVLDLPVTDLFVTADWVPEGELPTFKPYLRAKCGDLSPAAMTEVQQAFEQIARKHGYVPDGPKPGEDET